VKLYPFQREMVDRFVTTPSVLCADDMGLGKTYEALALDLRRRTTQLNGYKQTDCKTLIVAPLSVVNNWVTHIKAIWPQARVAVINAKNRDAFITQLKQPYHYYVAHWEGVRLIPELEELRWWHIIADEVHRAKNAKAQQTYMLKRLKTSYKTGLSGTPADNHPQDLWSILNWLYPKIWTSFWAFKRHFVKIRVHNKGACFAHDPETGWECGGYHKNQYQETCGVANAEELHGRIDSYYIRRQKEHVLQDLPDKTYTQIDVELLPRQRRIYEQMKHEMLAWVGKHEEEPIAAPIVVAQLARLQQFALGYAELITVKRAKKGCPDCLESGLDKCIGHNVDLVRLMEPSSKLDALEDILKDNPDKQFVVFSSSRQIIELLGVRLNKLKIPHVLYTGKVSQGDKDRAVDLFQAGKARVFAGTIQAGGEGITLTAASTAIFLDRVWNPSKNRQAEDRIHRIGQKNACQIIDIVAKDTVDGGRLQQIRLKWSWLRELLGDKAREETRA
jgi:SNF2 family DNA or RNA helicase